MQRVEDLPELKRIANRMRQNIVKMIGEAGSGHPGGSLSATELVAALFFKVMRHDPKRPGWLDRDRFILSKGHACPVLYCAYAEAGYFDPAELMTLRKLGSRLQGHPDRRFLPILEASTGSLGNGLSIGMGAALAGRLDSKDYRVYVMMGDGECQEGQVWEAAMFAGYHKLDSLCAIVDYNKIQLDDWVNKILDLEPLAAKWESFGWRALVISGNDMQEVLDAYEQAKMTSGKPTVIIANTIKGKGVSFMENNVEFHGTAPNAQQVKQAIDELEKEAVTLA
jgi:transketolase